LQHCIDLRFVIIFSDGRCEKATIKRQLRRQRARSQQAVVDRRQVGRRPGANGTRGLRLVAVLDHVRPVPVEVSDRLAPAGDYIFGCKNTVSVRRRRRVNNTVQRDRQMQFPRPGHA